MGYFSNGTEGMAYEEKWCSRCVHNSGGCAVWSAHMSLNYDQHKNEQLKQVLDRLIPRDKKDGGNLKCRMFHKLKSARPDPDDGEPLLFEKIELNNLQAKEVA